MALRKPLVTPLTPPLTLPFDEGRVWDSEDGGGALWVPRTGLGLTYEWAHTTTPASGNLTLWTDDIAGANLDVSLGTPVVNATGFNGRPEVQLTSDSVKPVSGTTSVWAGEHDGTGFYGCAIVDLGADVSTFQAFYDSINSTGANIGSVINVLNADWQYGVTNASAAFIFNLTTTGDLATAGKHLIEWMYDESASPKVVFAVDGVTLLSTSTVGTPTSNNPTNVPRLGTRVNGLTPYLGMDVARWGKRFGTRPSAANRAKLLAYSRATYGTP